MKSVIIAVLLSLSTFVTFAQDQAAPAKTFWTDPIGDPMFPIYIVGFLVILVTTLIMITGIQMINVVNMLAEEARRERAAKLGLPFTPRQSWWSRLSRQMHDYVPLEEESTIELDHNFDGIKELDNHLPPWWKWLFVATAVWAVIYMVVYHVSDTYPLMIQEYTTEMTEAESQIRKLKASQPQEAVDENSLVFTADVAMIEKGKEVFNTMNCGSCHRADGGGNAIGPNLTDEFWIHGGGIRAVFSTIKNGAVDKGMPAWGKSLSPADVRNLAFFVMSLQGTRPPNAKAPQGEKYLEPSPQAISDSTAVQAAL